MQNCPTNFIDHGTLCEAPSLLRQTIKAFLMSCQPGQVDRNGDCFEPQTFSMTPQGPVQNGCGCVKRTRQQRLQCPTGYEIYNNSCVSACPSGYESIKDPNTGQITSLFCMAPCPLQNNSKLRWTSTGQMCAKPVIKRLRHTVSGVDQQGNHQIIPEFGIPSSILSLLSARPLGSSVNDRVRTGQTVGQSNAAASNFFTESWRQLSSQPVLILSLILGTIAFFFLGRPLLNGLGRLFGSIAASAGQLTEGISSVAKGALDVGASTLEIGATAESNIAKNLRN